MASPSEIAAAEAGKNVDKAVLSGLISGLRANYSALRATLQVKTDLKEFTADDDAFKRYIQDTAQEILDDKTERARRLRETIKDKAPTDYEALANASKIRKAAQDAVYNNAGDMEMLGGSTVGNAIAGFFGWLFSGNFLEKIGQLFSWMFGGERPAGLKEAIADRAVGNAVSDFQSNMAAQGVDTAPGTAGAKAVEAFARKAEIKAKSLPAEAEPDPQATPVDGLTPEALEKRKAADEKLRQATAIPDSANPEQVNTALRAHFLGAASHAHDSLSHLIETQKMSEAEKENAKALLAQAKESLTEQGVKLAQQAIEGGMPKDFEFQLIKATFAEMQEKLKNDPANAALLSKVMVEFNKPDATIDTVRTALDSSGDKKLGSVSFVIAKVNEALVREIDPSTHDTMQTQLFRILRAAASPEKKGAFSEQAATQAAQRKKAENDLQKRDTAKSQVNTRLREALDPVALKQGIEKAVAEKAGGWDNPVGRPFAYALASVLPSWTSLKAGKPTWDISWVPSDGERQQMAEFLSREMQDIVKDKMDKQIDAGRPINTAAVVSESMDELKKRMEKSLKEGKLAAVWEGQKEGVISTVREQLSANLQAAAPQLHELMGVSVAGANDAAARTFAMSDKPGQPFNNLPNPLPAGGRRAAPPPGARRMANVAPNP